MKENNDMHDTTITGVVGGLAANDAFRVSFNEDGEPRWWLPLDAIPASHTGLRAATKGEAGLMRRILASKNPPVELGQKLAAMMDARP